LNLRGALILVMLANDHGVDADEVRAICDFYHEATNTPLCEEDVRKNVVQALSSHTRLCDFARQVAPQLTFQGKSLFLRGAVRVLSAKSQLRSDAAAVVAELAEAFQISPQQVEKIVGPS
jgi:hypothetical protein